MTSRVRTAVTTALSAAVLALLVAATDARIAHSTDPATVVVSYAVTLGEIASADGGPSVRIYGDGRVEAHYPAYMKGAGDHGARLSADELDALLGSLADTGLLDFDAAAVARDRRDAITARRNAAALAGRLATMEIVADADTTTIEIHVDRAHRKVVWNGVRDDARLYPGIAALQGLAAAERHLRDVMERTAQAGAGR